MGRRSPIVLGSLAGAALIHFVFIACSAQSPQPALDAGAGDAPTLADVVDAVAAGDVAHALDVAADAAGHVVDATVDQLADLGRAETNDAMAGGGPASEFTCDVTTVQRVTGPTGYTSVTTTYYAAVPTTVAARDVPNVHAVVCDPVEDVSPCAYWSTQPMFTCTSSGVALGPSMCAQANVIFDGGRALVPCGSANVTTASGVTTNTGSRYRRAFVRLP